MESISNSEDAVDIDKSEEVSIDLNVSVTEQKTMDNTSTVDVTETKPKTSMAEDCSEDFDVQSDAISVDHAVIEKLTYGVMDAVLPTLQKSQTTLTEVIENQRILMETLEQENAKFKECTDFVEVQKMMSKAKLYHNKLLSIKRDMIILHEKSAKLKKRALKLQQQKQKQLLLEERAREQELDREQQLVAKLSSANR